MTDLERNLIHKYRMDGLSQKQISELTGIAQNTITSKRKCYCINRRKSHAFSWHDGNHRHFFWCWAEVCIESHNRNIDRCFFSC